MLRKSKRSLAILLTLAMLATLFVGVPMASASPGYSCSNVYATSDNGNRQLGSMYAEVDINDMTATDSVTIRLPQDFKMFTQNTTSANVVVNGFDVDTAATTRTIALEAIAPVAADGVLAGDNFVELVFPAIDNALFPTGGVGTANNINVALTADNEIKLTYVGGNTTAGEKTGYFYVKFPNVYVPSGGDTEVKVVAEAQSSSGFPSTAGVTVATVGSGKSTLSVDSIKSLTGDGFLDVIRIKEDRQGALDVNSKTIKLKLPKGMTWDLGALKTTVATDWGFSTYAAPVNVGAVAATAWAIAPANGISYGVINGSERELIISVGSATASEGMLKITPAILIDESEADFGDIQISVAGEADVTNSTIVIGSYSDFGAVVTAKTTKNIIAGRHGEEIGEFYVEENGPDSLAQDRYIELSLPDNAKWETAPAVSIDKGDIVVAAAAAVGTDLTTVKYKITAGSNTKSKILFKNGKVSTAVNKDGELKITIGGRAGVEGEVVVGTLLSPLKASVANVTELKIGVQAQEMPDFVVTEQIKEALKKDGTLDLVLPIGAFWAATPKVEVTEGDVELKTESISRTTGYGNYMDTVRITIKSESSTPSTIKIMGGKITVDRTMAEGSFSLDVRGTAVQESSNAPAGNPNLCFPTLVKAAVVPFGSVVTPAPGEQKAQVAFTIGETKYLANGVEQTMDVAPYIKEDRTYMPIRYVAMSLGVAEQNIMWDDAVKTATLIKGDKVVQVKIGSKVMMINGININMDVAPEITNDRTMLPLRWIGQAFGANFTWDDATKTATMNL